MFTTAGKSFSTMEANPVSMEPGATALGAEAAIANGGCPVHVRERANIPAARAATQSIRILETLTILCLFITGTSPPSCLQVNNRFDVPPYRRQGTKAPKIKDREAFDKP